MTVKKATKTPKKVTKKEVQKENDPITQLKEPYKVETFYRDTFTFMQYPVSKTFLHHLAIEYVKWADEEETAIRTDQFLIKKHISKKTFYEWMEKYQYLKDAHETVLSRIAIRRELGASARDKKTGITKYTPHALIMMHHYDDDWKRGVEWKAKMAQKEDALTNIKVVMEAFPSSPLVPEKKKEEEE